MIPHMSVQATDGADRIRRIGAGRSPATCGRRAGVRRRSASRRRPVVGRRLRPRRRSAPRPSPAPAARCRWAAPAPGPSSPSSASAAAISAAERGSATSGRRSATAHVDAAPAGSRVIDAPASSASGRPGACDDVEQQQPGEQAVAGGGEVGGRSRGRDCSPPSDVAAARRAPRARSGRRPAVSTTSMPARRHRQAEAEVRHHRDDDGVVGAAARGRAGRARAMRDDLVAVDDVAGVVDREHPVGVAVEGEPEVGAARDDRGRQRRRVGRAAAGR